MTAYVSNGLGPPAGGNTTINRTMLYEMDRNVREAVSFSIGDCCSDNKNYNNLVLKAQLLVDQKMRLFDINFLHKQRHGKDDSDRRFGNQYTCEKSRALFSEDCVAAIAGTIPAEREDKDRPRVVDLTKFSQLDRTLNTGYRSQFPPCFGALGN